MMGTLIGVVGVSSGFLLVLSFSCRLYLIWKGILKVKRVRAQVAANEIDPVLGLQRLDEIREKYKEVLEGVF